MKKKLTCMSIALAVLLCGCNGSGNNGPSSAEITQAAEQPEGKAQLYDFGLCDNIADGAILHAWCWSFDTIKDSMADIAAAGYTSVQTSPANAVIEGGGGGMQLMGKGKWYYQYQPTDWTIGNYQLGTEQDLIDMCAEADKYGIKIIVDVVPNHTAADISAVSQSLKDAAGGEEKLYHKNSQKRIVNYSSRTECTLYSLTGLPDVNTENKGFQDYFIAYLNRLIDDGADGFRYDTAKHIGLSDDPRDDEELPNNFWERVTTEIKDADRIFNYGEVLQGDNDRLNAYIGAIGHTTASDYGKYLRGYTTSGMLTAKLMSDMLTDGNDNVVTWVESHDNYTEKSSILLTDEQIIRAWSIIAAKGEGTPLFFDRPYGSSYDMQFGSMNRIGASGSFLYKDKTVAAVNHFRNAMTGEPTVMSNPEGNARVLLILRGERGAVLVNALDKDYEVSMPCSLPDGEYPDRSGNCASFTVLGGNLTGTLKASSTAVLYNDGYKEPQIMPCVWLDAESFALTADSTEVTLHVSGAESGEAVIDGKAQSFRDGDKATVTLSGDECEVRLSAGKDFETVMTYYFSRRQRTSAGSEISFSKPESWNDEIYVYIYDETVNPIIKNASWPGEKMTPTADGGYTYTLGKDFDSALVIFSDKTGRQYPAAMEPGMELEAFFEYSVPEGQ